LLNHPGKVIKHEERGIEDGGGSGKHPGERDARFGARPFQYVDSVTEPIQAGVVDRKKEEKT